MEIEAPSFPYGTIAPALPADARRVFVRQWLRHPLRTAAVIPSSPRLARLMVRQLPSAPNAVVELGAGTGVFTEAILRAGVPADRLLVVEINAAFVAHLRARFPHTHVAQSDARRLRDPIERHRFIKDRRPDAVVSGLGLIDMAIATRMAVLNAAFSVLSARGRFIQFTYAPFNPVRPRELRALGLSARRAAFTWHNFPPAAVYVYQRSS